MKVLVLIGILVIFSTSQSHRHNHHHGYGPDEDDNMAYPPWWHPRTPGGGKPGSGPDLFHGHFDPFGSGDSDEDMFSPPAGRGRWNFDGPWHRPTTEKPRVTFPIYQPSSTSTTTTSTTTAPKDSGSSSARPGINLVLESCKKACPVTTEHNPVCGTDNITYGNIGKLECARRCGVDVTLKRRSICGTISNDGNNNSGTNNTGNNNTGNNNSGNNNSGNNNGGDNNSGNNNAGNNNSGNGGGNFVIQACMRSCPVTSEYNPVCGTNNITYANPGRLECAQRCGLAVNILRRSSCSVPISRDEGVEICITTCSVTSEYNPVCGTDNLTYANEGRLECARNCGRNVQLSRRTSCSVPGPIGPWGSTTSSPNGNGGGSNGGGSNGGGSNGGGSNGGGSNGGGSNGGGSNGGGSKNPTVTELLACMQLCQSTLEVNPVCGTDGVTYSNAGRLLCAQSCGVDVKVRMFAPCLGSQITMPPTPSPTICPTLPTPTQGPNSVQDCVNKCLVSLELKPVCGTDGVTYINIESLRCKMNCGVAVSVLKESPCGSSTPTAATPTVATPTAATPTAAIPTADTPPVWQNTDRTTQPTVTAVPTPQPDTLQGCINRCSNSLQSYQPVCGTDGITYSNMAALQCVRRCGKDVELRSQSICVGGSKDETTTENDLGFTIPSILLSSIFPDYKPDTTTTSAPTDDSFEGSYDLDERYGTPNSTNT